MPARPRTFNKNKSRKKKEGSGDERKEPVGTEAKPRGTAGAQTVEEVPDIDPKGWCTKACLLQWFSPFHNASPLTEMVLYMIFLMLFIGCIGYRKEDVSHRYYTTQYDRWSNQFFNTGYYFDDITTVERIWIYLEGSFIDGLEYDEGYPDVAPYYGSYPIGDVILRQKRVKGEECDEGYDRFVPTIPSECFKSFSADKEDKSCFGVNCTFTWTPDPQKKMNDGLWDPFLKYGRGGFVIKFQLPPNRTRIQEQIAEMKANGFIDKQTRFLSFERQMTEPNSQLTVAIQQSLQFRYVGTIKPKEDYRIARVLAYETARQKMVLFFECCFAYLIIYYIIQEFTEMYQKGKDYLNDAWNVIDILNLGVFSIVIYIRIAVDVAAYNFANSNFMNDDYINMQSLLYSFNFMNYANAFNAVLCFLKVFKYLAVSPKLGMLNKVIAAAAGDFFAFLFMFVVVMLGYTMAFNMAFGNNIKQFNGMIDAGMALFMWSLGDFDFAPLEAQNYPLGALLFITYMVLMMITLLNFAIAIVSNAFDDVNSQRRAEAQDDFADELKLAILSGPCCSCFGKKTRLRLASTVVSYITDNEIDGDGEVPVDGDAKGKSEVELQTKEPENMDQAWFEETPELEHLKTSVDRVLKYNGNEAIMGEVSKNREALEELIKSIENAKEEEKKVDEDGQLAIGMEEQDEQDEQKELKE